MPKMNSPTPSYSFHGSNSSHSKDSGQGGRTYHVPNYATSYANEKSHLISVTFDEDKGAKKTIIVIVFLFLILLACVSVFLVQGLERCYAKIPSQHIFSEPSTPAHSENTHLADGTTHVPLDTVGRETDSVANQLKVGNGKNVVSIGVEDSQGHNPGTALYWDNLQGASHCAAYGTRTYTARLRNVSLWANRTRACTKTPIQINGDILPSPGKCTVNGLFGEIRGYWNVTFKEGDCTPVWGKFSDKGCTSQGSQKRLFRSKLWNLRKGEDRLLLCQTAPAYILGVHRPKPDLCEAKGLWGTYGTWLIEDKDC